MNPKRGSRKVRIIPAITTVEMKCGAKAIVWIVRRSLIQRISFSASARMTAAGNAKAMRTNAMTTVLRTMFQNWNDPSRRSNSRNPTQGLPWMPLSTLKFLKAITTPYIGAYMKISIQAIGIAISR